MGKWSLILYILYYCGFTTFTKREVIEMVVPQNGWLITRENPMNMDDSGVPPLMETLK